MPAGAPAPDRPGRAPVAVVLVRNPAVHDARVFRAAETLRGLGYAPVILAVESAREPGAPVRRDGVPIHRLRPRSPLRRPGRGARAAAAAPLAPAAGAATGGLGGRARALRLARRANRLVVTGDFYRRAFGFLRAHRPTLVHCNDFNTMWPGVAARVLLGARLIYDAHELWPDRNGRTEDRRWLIAAEAVFVRAAHRCIVTSPGHAEAMARRYRIAPPTVVRNVPAPVDGDAPEPAPGPPTIVYLGGVQPGRGLEQAIAALGEIAAARLRIIGPGRPDFRAGLLQLAGDHGVADRVSVGQAVAPERVVATAREAHVALALFQPTCRSYVLGLPNKLAEYAVAGVPVLSSDLPVMADFVRELGTGEVVDATSPEAVAAGLRRLLAPERQREVRTRLAGAGERLSWARERAVLERVYREAVG